jgi:hypothetical protein
MSATAGYGPIDWAGSIVSSFSHGGAQCLEAVTGPDGAVYVRNSKDPLGNVVRFTSPEWTAFLAGAKTGEFDPLVG